MSAARLERAVTVLGLKGAEIDTVVNGENRDAPKYLAGPRGFAHDIDERIRLASANGATSAPASASASPMACAAILAPMDIDERIPACPRGPARRLPRLSVRVMCLGNGPARQRGDILFHHPPTPALLTG